MIIQPLLITLLATQGFARAIHDFVEHERRETTDSPWVKVAPVSKDVKLPIRIGFVQSNLDKGHDILMDISDPDSENYGKIWSADAVRDLFAPKPESVSAVTAWLESEGVIKNRTGLSVNKQWLQLDAPVSEAEGLFRTKYFVYRHKISGVQGIGCDSYQLPSSIREYVDFIKPGIHPLRRLVKQTSIKPRKKIEKRSPVSPEVYELVKRNKGVNCDVAITPGCIAKLYNITDTITKQPGNILGLYESLNNYMSVSDLHDFLSAESNIPPNTVPLERSVDGAPSFLNISDAVFVGEPNLDVQCAITQVYPDDIEIQQVDDRHWEHITEFGGYRGEDGAWNTWFDALDGSYCNYTAFGITGDTPGIDPVYPDPYNGTGSYKGQLQCGTLKLTPVISTSYGDDERDYPVNYLRRQCNEWMKLGMQGSTIMNASGDEGVAPEAGLCEGPHHAGFGPADPVTCPYVTGVSSTTLPPGRKAGVDREVATTKFGGTGGFSNVYPIPKFQEKALAEYFKNHNPPYKYYETKYSRGPSGPGRYNRAGRGFPDVSAIGQNIVMWNHGAPYFGWGTSASSPYFASIINRINNHRKANGKNTIGFINQVLYKHPEILNDIIEGNNPGCNTTGFEAVPGWDPVTGLGTPNYGKMKEFFLSLP